MYLFLIIFPFSILSQNNPINFENSGFGSSWTVCTENDDNPNLLFVNNIDTNGINNSDIVQTLARCRMDSLGPDVNHYMDLI